MGGIFGPVPVIKKEKQGKKGKYKKQITLPYSLDNRLMNSGCKTNHCYD